jgi:hypothetical protein
MMLKTIRGKRLKATTITLARLVATRQKQEIVKRLRLKRVAGMKETVDLKKRTKRVWDTDAEPYSPIR